MSTPQSDELRNFLLSRREKASMTGIDWEERRRQWIDEIEQLYKNVGELLADSIKDGLVTVSRGEKTIEEEFLGAYSVAELNLKIGGETVRLSPKGRNVFGAKGRVDLVGDLDAVTLVLESTDQWNVVLSRVPRHVAALDRKTLAEALRRVMR